MFKCIQWLFTYLRTCTKMKKLWIVKIRNTRANVEPRWFCFVVYKVCLMFCVGFALGLKKSLKKDYCALTWKPMGFECCERGCVTSH